MNSKFLNYQKRTTKNQIHRNLIKKLVHGALDSWLTRRNQSKLSSVDLERWDSGVDGLWDQSILLCCQKCYESLWEVRIG